MIPTPIRLGPLVLLLLAAAAMLSLVCEVAKAPRPETSFDRTVEHGGRVERFCFSATWAETMASLKDEAGHAVRSALTNIIDSSSFQALFFECIPVSHSTANSTRFEFVLVDTDALASTQADATAFAEHFTDPSVDVVTFMNLGHDATLVVPTPQTQTNVNYAHLSSFLRTATDRQIQFFWRAVGAAALASLAAGPAAPVWMSTSGLGVPWVHLRLDSRPKYYTYSDFKAFSHV